MSQQHHSGMVRQLFFGFLHGVDHLEARKWYVRYHAPEVVRWYGPWLRRYETFQLIEPGTAISADALQRWGLRWGYHTELWYANFHEFTDSRVGSARPHTPGSWSQTATVLSAMTMIPAHPTDVFAGQEPNHETPVVRWLRVFRYPDAVSAAEGEKWYRAHFVPETQRLQGLKWYISYQTIDFPYPNPQRNRKWHRVEELWFDNLSAAHKALQQPLAYSAPEWAKDKSSPFVELYSELARVKADIDFLRDLPIRSIP